jgi:hypothetical protein
MNTPTFAEWLAHWGEERLAENLDQSQKCYRRMWEERENPGFLWWFPAWELCLGSYWHESPEEWHSRWKDCGGKLSEDRMIAAKWDIIWGRLSSTFYDGLGYAYPPYARSSCAYWLNIDQDEAIVVGAISESQFKDYMAQFKREPPMDKDGKPFSKEFLLALRRALEEEIYRGGGPRPGATHTERVSHERKQRKESFARAQAEYERRRNERDEQNSVFRLLEQVEASLRDLPSVQDSRRWEWLCTTLNTLTTTPHFDRYPNWRARAWLAHAEMYATSSDRVNELLCLEQALQLNSKLPIKRRIKKLKPTA